MPASRWNIDLNHIQYETSEDDTNFDDHYYMSIPAEDEGLVEEPTGPQPEFVEESTVKLPNSLPILPLRGLVVYPQTGVPLTIGQPRSIRLVDDVVVGDRMIGLIASKEPELENPGPENLYQVGTAAIIHRLFRAPDGTIRLLVQGISRFRVVEYTATEPYLQANIVPYPETEENGLEVDALADRKSTRLNSSHQK